MNIVNMKSAIITSATIKRVRLAAMALGVIAVTAACSDNPLDTTRAESPIARDINGLFWLVMIISIVVFVLVQGALIYMSARYRVKGDPLDDEAVYADEEFPEQIHGNERLEITWTILPAVLMAVIGVVTLSVLFRLDDVEAQDRQQLDRIEVVGQQWWWEYHYYTVENPNEAAFVTANDVVIPVGEEVRLQVTSRDVIHSFWIPRLNGKRDAVPGRVSPWTIEAEAPGRYMGQCTEFCGLSHAYMRMFAVAIDADEWTVWAQQQMQPQTIPVEGDPGFNGYQVFNANCAICHSISGVTDVNADEAVDDFTMYTRPENGTVPDIILDHANQVSGAAPNLTHLMSRSTFGGSMFDLYDDPDSLDYATIADAGTLNRADLEAWILNAPAEKPNAADLVEGSRRGMPSFTALTDQELDDLVDYLLTLK